MDQKELEKEKEQYFIYNANGNFFCDCSLCKENDFNTNQIQKGLNAVPQKLLDYVDVKAKEEEYEKFGGFEKSFFWLMEHLLPPSQQENILKGCELIFPDTAFYQNGKARLVVKMDKDYCLTGIKKAVKLAKDEIYKDFSTVVRERKKDNLGIFYEKYGAEFKRGGSQGT